MEKPVGPPNIVSKIKPYNPVVVFGLVFILGNLFLLGASTCKVTDFEINMYKSAEDCMTKRIANMTEEGTILDPYNISRLERYCARYDR